MIGSAFKKFATENGLKVSNGVAYGSLRGYAATLAEGAGYKQIIFATKMDDPAQKGAFLDAVNAAQVEKTYRVQNFLITPNSIQVVFQDTIGTMKKIGEFVDWFVPVLQQHGATTADICPECGGQVTNGCWKLISGAAYHMHESCGEKVREQVRQENETRTQEAEGSYGRGVLGALLGAALGAVVWAIVLMLGYVASIVGLLIGWLSEKGYTLLRGKQGKGKVAILIVAIIFGVLLGTFAADAITVAQMISAGEAGVLTYGDIPAFIVALLLYDGEYLAATLGNVVMGLIFAGLGVFALLRRAGREVADTKFVDLK